MRDVCRGPMAALATLLSTHGILPSATATIASGTVTRASAIAGEQPVSRFDPPDSPPPRA